MKMSELMPLLAAAGAKLSTELCSHDATLEIYDALPGDEHENGETRWKSGRVNGMAWTVFAPRELRDAEVSA